MRRGRKKKEENSTVSDSSDNSKLSQKKPQPAKNTSLEPDDLIFTFKYCSINVFPTDELKEQLPEAVEANHFIIDVKTAVDSISKQIVIDKSYVDFPENKHEKTFVKKEGWYNLCQKVKATKFGAKCTKAENAEIQQYYELLIIYYVYLCLDDLGYNVSWFSLQMEPHTSFLSEVELDYVHEWKHYPGRWQTWQSK